MLFKDDFRHCFSNVRLIMLNDDSTALHGRPIIEDLPTLEAFQTGQNRKAKMRPFKKLLKPTSQLHGRVSSQGLEQNWNQLTKLFMLDSTEKLYLYQAKVLEEQAILLADLFTM